MITPDYPHWMHGQGVRLNVNTQTPLAELVSELAGYVGEHPDATVDLDFDPDPYGGFGEHYIEITW